MDKKIRIKGYLLGSSNRLEHPTHGVRFTSVYGMYSSAYDQGTQSSDLPTT